MIHFYDKNRKVVMELSSFSFDNEQEQGIKFFADVSYAFYKASRYIKDYKVYFESFLKELELLYDNKTKIAQFIPIERQIEIYFKQCDEFGHIDVSIKLNYFDIDYTMHGSTLSINYTIDQSFLPELIDEIDRVVKMNV
jgi:hypothetical protein